MPNLVSKLEASLLMLIMISHSVARALVYYSKYKAANKICHLLALDGMGLHVRGPSGSCRKTMQEIEWGSNLCVHVNTTASIEQINANANCLEPPALLSVVAWNNRK